MAMMKKLLGIMVLGLMICNTGFSAVSLTKDQKGTIKFQSIPVITLNQFLNGETDGKTITISGSLKKLIKFSIAGVTITVSPTQVGSSINNFIYYF